jgi:hypothetical protein
MTPVFKATFGDYGSGGLISDLAASILFFCIKDDANTRSGEKSCRKFVPIKENLASLG